MKDDEFMKGVFAGMALMFGVLLVVGILGDKANRTNWQNDCVEHGAAEYVVDEKGEVTWRWKESK